MKSSDLIHPLMIFQRKPNCGSLSDFFLFSSAFPTVRRQEMASHIMTLPRVRGSGQLILSPLWMVSERHQFVAYQPPIKLTKSFIWKRKVFSLSMLLSTLFQFWTLVHWAFAFDTPGLADPTMERIGKRDLRGEASTPATAGWCCCTTAQNQREMPPLLPSSVLHCALAEMHRRARALAFRPATIFAFNVFLISHEVTGVLGDYHCIIGRLCEH